MAKRIDQLLSGFADGDAISQEARLIQDALRANGIESDIYAPKNTTTPAIAYLSRPIEDYDNKARDAVIFHYSISSGASNLFLASSCQRIVRYHNITPECFLRGFDDKVATQLKDARSELLAIASDSDEVWAVSNYNALEAKELGIQKVKVIPLFFHPSSIDVPPEQGTLNKYGDGLTNILFVGRMAPNKCVEDLIVAFGWYQKINPQSRLILVGSEWSCPKYFGMLRALAKRLDLPNVCFEGFVNDAALAACYETASLFVCPSRHEGYCLPLIEAMCHNVPVIARNTGGMPEALGDSGILFETDDPKELAVLIDRVSSDTELRQRVLQAQSRRLQTLNSRDIAHELSGLLNV